MDMPKLDTGRLKHLHTLSLIIPALSTEQTLELGFAPCAIALLKSSPPTNSISKVCLIIVSTFGMECIPKDRGFENLGQCVGDLERFSHLVEVELDVAMFASIAEVKRKELIGQLVGYLKISQELLRITF